MGHREKWRDRFDEEMFIRSLLRHDSIGEAMIDTLDEEFDSTFEVASASRSELREVDGIGSAISSKIRSAAEMAGGPKARDYLLQEIDEAPEGSVLSFDEVRNRVSRIR